MLQRIAGILPTSKQALISLASRNVCVSAALMNKTDPIQQLFVDKTREYYKKKAASKSGLIDMTPEMQKSLNDELEKITKLFGSSATNEFPTFNFNEPKLDSIYTEKLEKHQ